MREITVPVHGLGERQLAGLRQNMLAMAGPDGEEVAGVDTGAGLGSDAIWLWYHDAEGGRHYVYVRGADLLRVWLRGEAADPRIADALEREFPDSEAS
jgi:hypothetical protein